MSGIIVTKPDIEENDICGSYWGRNACLNKAEFILKNTENHGYAVMCEPHVEALKSTMPQILDVVIIHKYTPELHAELIQIGLAIEEQKNK